MDKLVKRGQETIH